MNTKKKHEQAGPEEEQQGPMRNEHLQDERYRNKPLPGDDPDVPAGQGSGARTSPIVVPRPPKKEKQGS